MNDSTSLNSSDEEETTADKVLHKLTLAWVNEKNCPELLQHKSELVDCMMDQIQQMEKNLLAVNHEDFRLVPHQMEVDRIRYVISSYLRTRLDKIETFPEYFLHNDLVASPDDRLMSEGELAYADNFLRTTQKYFFEEALKYMPTVLHDSDGVNTPMEVKPNLNSTVFIRMVKSATGILICDQVVELAAGSRHLLPYKDVKHLISEGSAFLL